MLRSWVKHMGCLVYKEPTVAFNVDLVRLASLNVDLTERRSYRTLGLRLCVHVPQNAASVGGPGPAIPKLIGAALVNYPTTFWVTLLLTHEDESQRNRNLLRGVPWSNRPKLRNEIFPNRPPRHMCCDAWAQHTVIVEEDEVKEAQQQAERRRPNESARPRAQMLRHLRLLVHCTSSTRTRSRASAPRCALSVSSRTHSRTLTLDAMLDPPTERSYPSGWEHALRRIRVPRPKDTFALTTPIPELAHATPVPQNPDGALTQPRAPSGTQTLPNARTTASRSRRHTRGHIPPSRPHVQHR
ncbi:hypothetical protein DFH08DRAFT_894861 [Mycena albidolilacea]|uniref:Uncharacterized protein n=1 Tax=Mycena albidolilacea TaxID=1033008 RepID=A0AAD6ZAW5_9AGAR|nr:hypothetical protein DFH08DRAFT_894861 [Mycena albidolilacea]